MCIAILTPDCLCFQGNHNAESIDQRIKGLQEKLDALDAAAARRKAGLIDNSAFLQFMWKTDVVESWIADKETQVRSDDYGRDLSSVQTLLTKQVTLVQSSIGNNTSAIHKCFPGGIVDILYFSQAQRSPEVLKKVG